MALMDGTRKTDQENVILYYVRMSGSRDIEVWKSQKTAESAFFTIFYDFQT